MTTYKTIKKFIKEYGGFIFLILFWAIFLPYMIKINYGFIGWLFVSWWIVGVSWLIGNKHGEDNYKLPEPSDEEIRVKFGKVLEVVSQAIFGVDYPESLLPYPKKVIENSFKKEILIREILLKNKESSQKQSLEGEIELFRVGLIQLSSFINDEEAIKNNKKTLEAVRLGLSNKKNNN